MGRDGREMVRGKFSRNTVGEVLIREMLWDILSGRWLWDIIAWVGPVLDVPGQDGLPPGLPRLVLDTVSTLEQEGLSVVSVRDVVRSVETCKKTNFLHKQCCSQNDLTPKSA